MGGIYGVIVAGGTGTRMENPGLPKQFLDLDGVPIIIHTIKKFMTVSSFREVLALVPEEWNAYTGELIRKYFSGDDRIRILDGGATRNETLMNAVGYLESDGKLDGETVIVTHDSVRPFVTRRILEEHIRSVLEYGAVNTVIPAVDTIIRSADARTIDEIPDRNTLFQVQTPQSFKAVQLRKLYRELSPAEKESLTDACKILLIKGVPVYLVRGEPFNMKITYPSDLAAARALLEWERRQPSGESFL